MVYHVHQCPDRRRYHSVVVDSHDPCLDLHRRPLAPGLETILGPRGDPAPESVVSSGQARRARGVQKRIDEEYFYSVVTCSEVG